MNLAILSNAQPLSRAGLLQRTSTLAPVLLSQLDVARHELPPDAVLNISAFVTDTLAWSQQKGGAITDSARSFPAVFKAIQAFRPDWVLVDYDPKAGKGRDRVAFLEVAGTLAASAASESWAFGLVLGDEAVQGADSDFFPGSALSARQILNRLASRCQRFITFSSGAAQRLGKRFRRGFEVVSVSAVVPACPLTRRQARRRLGFPEQTEELLIGVLGRFPDLAWDLLQAGLKESLRLSPGARLLYLGPDGQRFRDRSMPLPFLDAGTPEADEVAVRLRALDFAILPLKDGCHSDDQALLACLRNGTPVVATAPVPGQEPEFLSPPEGVALVPGKELGAFLEAIEVACERALQGIPETVDVPLQDCYAERFSAGRMHRQLGIPVLGQCLDGKGGSIPGVPSIVSDA